MQLLSELRNTGLGIRITARSAMHHLLSEHLSPYKPGLHRAGFRGSFKFWPSSNVGDACAWTTKSLRCPSLPQCQSAICSSPTDAKERLNCACLGTAKINGWAQSQSRALRTISNGHRCGTALDSATNCLRRRLAWGRDAVWPGPPDPANPGLPCSPSRSRLRVACGRLVSGFRPHSIRGAVILSTLEVQSRQSCWQP